MKTLHWLLVMSLSAATTVSAYESAFKKTAVGDAEVKILPPRTIMEVTGEGSYFDRSNKLFMRLFRFIKANDIEMTVPVQSDIARCRMCFFLPQSDEARGLTGTNGVAMRQLPERVVASLGGRGSYTESNFKKALQRLDRWLKEGGEYVPAGEPYAVYWNGPIVPGFLKRFDVHIPVTRRDTVRRPLPPAG